MQSRIFTEGREKELLVRVFVDISEDSTEVVTFYRTSKIDKYWR